MNSRNVTGASLSTTLPSTVTSAFATVLAASLVSVMSQYLVIRLPVNASRSAERLHAPGVRREPLALFVLRLVRPGDAAEQSRLLDLVVRRGDLDVALVLDAFFDGDDLIELGHAGLLIGCCCPNRTHGRASAQELLARNRAGPRARVHVLEQGSRLVERHGRLRALALTWGAAGVLLRPRPEAAGAGWGTSWGLRSSGCRRGWALEWSSGARGESRTRKTTV